MRLTLRNLLAYLNDELSPEQTKELGPRVAGSEAAQQMIEKLQTLLRRRRLSAPDLSLGDESSPQEADYVAAYIDCELTEEEQARFEALCLENDVFLAEVAACLSLKTLGEQGAIKIPPTAYQRMYGLAKGREAIKDRKPPQPVNAAAQLKSFRADGSAEDEEEALLLLDPLYQKVDGRWSGRFVPIAASFLLLGLCGLLYWVSQSQPVPQPLADAGAPAAIAAAPSQPAAPPKPADGRLVVAGAMRPEALIGRFAGFAAARPALPPNLMLALGDELLAAPAAAPAEPLTDVPPPPPVIPPAVEPKPEPKKPAPIVKLAAGQYESDPAKEGLAFRQIGPGEWRPVRAQTPILTGEALVALPAARAEVALANNQLRLTLVGTLPADVKENAPNHFLEAAALVNHNPDVDLDLTLLRGRFLLSRKAEGTAKLLLRFQGAVWNLTLLSPDAEVALEAMGRLPAGADAPQSRLFLYVAKGVVELQRGEEKLLLREKQGLAWDSKQGAGLGTPRETPPTWLAKRPANAIEARDALAAVQKRLSDRLAQAGPSMSWFRVACDELLLSRRPWELQLAVYALAALDQISPVVAALDEPERPVVRRAAADALANYLGRQPGQTAKLAELLAERGYSDADAAALIGLLKGTDEVNKATIEKLLKLMDHPRLALREQAFLTLGQLVKLEKPGYDPAAAGDARAKAIDGLRKKLLQ